MIAIFAAEFRKTDHQQHDVLKPGTYLTSNQLSTSTDHDRVYEAYRAV